jgi:hypothetical protein
MNVESKGLSRVIHVSPQQIALTVLTDIHRKNPWKSVASVRTLQSRIIIEEILGASLKIQRIYYATGKRTP